MLCVRTVSRRLSRSTPELEEPLKDILDTTYGLIVYQEQVMAIAQRVANYTLVRRTCCAVRWVRRRRRSWISSTLPSTTA